MANKRPTTSKKAIPIPEARQNLIVVDGRSFKDASKYRVSPLTAKSLSPAAKKGLQERWNKSTPTKMA